MWSSWDFSRPCDDYSLVGLASILMDGVCMTAVRETVVLYAEAVLTSDELFPENVYEWNVSEEFAVRTNRLIEEYNRLFRTNLPAAKADNAERFFEEYSENRVDGRCVRIGTDIISSPTRYYHWSIDRARDGSLSAGSFWSEEIWTTERYRESQRRTHIERTRSPRRSKTT
jgi:tRNA(His) 5'-end guanylyltransferase